jgi:chromatin remodeling complex protein RSC6
VASFEYLVHTLAGVRANGRNRRDAKVVASHLIDGVLKDQWNKLSDDQTDSLISESTDRLWEKYMSKRNDLKQSPKEAAEKAINEELTFFKKSLTQSK